MGKRPADSKHIEVEHDRAEYRRIELERDKFEWEKQRRIYGAAAFGTGVFFTVRTVAAAGDKIASGEVMKMIRTYLQGSTIEKIDLNDVLKADYATIGLSLMAAGMVFAGYDPTDVWDSVIPDQLL